MLTLYPYPRRNAHRVKNALFCTFLHFSKKWKCTFLHFFTLFSREPQGFWTKTPKNPQKSAKKCIFAFSQGFKCPLRHRPIMRQETVIFKNLTCHTICREDNWLRRKAFPSHHSSSKRSIEWCQSFFGPEKKPPWFPFENFQRKEMAPT